MRLMRNVSYESSLYMKETTSNETGFVEIVFDFIDTKY